MEYEEFKAKFEELYPQYEPDSQRQTDIIKYSAFYPVFFELMKEMVQEEVEKAVPKIADVMLKRLENNINRRLKHGK